MILLVDAGNTRIKWGRLEGFPEGVPLIEQGAWPTADVARLGADWAARFGPRFVTDEKARRAVVACVAGDAVRAALGACLRALGFAVHWVASQPHGHGLDNRYQPPESLGVDRYAALVGAARRFQRDCVVVSVGTAMTADMLTAKGEFLGGCIVPGPDLMRGALSAGTAGVGLQAGGWQDFPRTTGSAVDTGVALALAGVVDGMRARLAAHQGLIETARPAVILTGGARSRLVPRLGGVVIEVDALVLEGLAWIARDLACVD